MFKKQCVVDSYGVVQYTSPAADTGMWWNMVSIHRSRKLLNE